MSAPHPVILVMMGVAGAGKTTVGQAVAKRLGWPFQEGDDFHPQANIDKMAAGRPLTDADRAPWLAKVEAWIAGQLALGQSGVIACSALKRAYRDGIVSGRDNVLLVYLKGQRAVIARRLKTRQGHFMPPSLLDSQLETLERPDPDERPIIVDIAQPLAAKVEQIVAAVAARAAASSLR